jgi:hypothetical protein
MGLNYTIDCRRCGSHSEHYTYTDVRTMRYDDLYEHMHLDTECAIRCPVCRAKLNTSMADFRAQVRVEKRP